MHTKGSDKCVERRWAVAVDGFIVETGTAVGAVVEADAGRDAVGWDERGVDGAGVDVTTAVVVAGGTLGNGGGGRDLR